MLKGKKRKTATKSVAPDLLPLRGLIHCPCCNRMLTGSKSKGKYKHYYYYHCLSECGVRHNAFEANKIFIEQLKDFRLNPAAQELLKLVITSVYKNRTKSNYAGKTQLLEDINKQNLKISKARALLLEGDIDADDYKKIKVEYTEMIYRLEAKLENISENPLLSVNINKLTNKIIETFSKIDELYINAELNKKRHIVCSLYPEKLHFDGFIYRTPTSNVVTDAILLINKELDGKKKGKTLVKRIFPLW